MRKEIRQVEVFIASDNREFDNEKDCLFYEKELRFKIKSVDLLIGTFMIIPFIFSLLIIHLYEKNEYFYVLSIMIFSGIVSLSSIIALIFRKWKK